MEVDISDNRWILFSTQWAIQRTNGKSVTKYFESNSSGYVTGNATGAMFGYIRRFTQIPGTTVVLIVDYDNNCIQTWNRSNNYVYDFVGSCGKQGELKNGVGTEARFKHPSSIIRDDKNLDRYYVADEYNYAIRIFDLSNKSVRTLATLSRTVPANPRTLLQDPYYSGYFLILTPFSIFNISKDDGTYKLIAGRNNSNRDNSDNTMFPYTLSNILHIIGSIYVAVPSQNKTLQLINLQIQNFETLCIPVCAYNGRLQGETSCQDCREFDQGSSLLFYQGVLYVGMKQKIVSLSGINLSVTLQYRSY